MKPLLIIISTVDGRRRGGAKFKQGANSFAPDHFTAPQLKEIARDTELTVVLGHTLEAGQVDDFLASLQAQLQSELQPLEALAPGAVLLPVQEEEKPEDGAGVEDGKSLPPKTRKPKAAE